VTIERQAIERFRGPEYRRLLDNARESLEGRGLSLDGAFSISKPDPAERAALVGLLGGRRELGAERTMVRLRALDAAVRTACGLTLVKLLEEIGLKVRDRRAEKDAKAAARAELLRVAEASPLHASAGWYRDWVRAPGRLARLVTQDGAHLLAQAIAAFDSWKAGRRPPRTAARSGRSSTFSRMTWPAASSSSTFRPRAEDWGSGSPGRRVTARRSRSPCTSSPPSQSPFGARSCTSARTPRCSGARPASSGPPRRPRRTTGRVTVLRRLPMDRDAAARSIVGLHDRA
jgi:hypothetical protein